MEGRSVGKNISGIRTYSGRTFCERTFCRKDVLKRRTDRGVFLGRFILAPHKNLHNVQCSAYTHIS
jgi:hypothetical protein